jgi:ribosome biogenesis GTPase
MSIDFSRLLPLGWSNFFSTQIPLEELDRARPARVVRVERDRYGVDAGAGEFFATLAGRVRHEHEGEALPTVGDWVLLATDDPVIVQCLERRTLIA